MQLTPETHRHLEDFMRVYFNDPQLTLPPVRMYGGRFARFFTRTFKIGAITIGRRIVVTPNLVLPMEDGQWGVPGWLLAHEGTHVIQYQRAGLFGFLGSYLKDYFKTLRKGLKMDAKSRNEAYRAIRQEEHARAAEEAYEQWLGASRSKLLAVRK